MLVINWVLDAEAVTGNARSIKSNYGPQQSGVFFSGITD
jgi:hypothetical protein